MILQARRDMTMFDAINAAYADSRALSRPLADAHQRAVEAIEQTGRISHKSVCPIHDFQDVAGNSEAIELMKQCDV